MVLCVLLRNSSKVEAMCLLCGVAVFRNYNLGVMARIPGAYLLVRCEKRKKLGLGLCEFICCF